MSFFCFNTCVHTKNAYTVLTPQQKESKMKPLAVRFSDKQKLRISDVSEVLGSNTSAISRAAMQIGLEAITEAASKSSEEASALIMRKAIDAMQ